MADEPREFPEPFRAVLAAVSGAGLREQGFAGEFPTFHRRRGDSGDVVDFQHWEATQRFCVNLVHVYRLPLRWGGTEETPLEQVRAGMVMPMEAVARRMLADLADSGEAWFLTGEVHPASG